MISLRTFSEYYNLLHLDEANDSEEVEGLRRPTVTGVSMSREEEDEGKGVGSEKADGSGRTASERKLQLGRWACRVWAACRALTKVVCPSGSG